MLTICGVHADGSVVGPSVIVKEVNERRGLLYIWHWELNCSMSKAAERPSRLKVVMPFSFGVIAARIPS